MNWDQNNINIGGDNIGDITFGDKISYQLPKKQVLDEACHEINEILLQFSNSNPTATESEQIAHVNMKADRSTKQRLVKALKDGGETAINEFILDNKYGKVAKSVIKSWLALES